MSSNNFSFEGNERSGPGAGNTTRSSGTSDYSPLATQGGSRPRSDFTTPPDEFRGFTSNEGSAPLSAVNPGPVYPSETQLGVAYGYAIRREDGTYTRLIRVDELEAVEGVPQSQGPEGLIILPPTRQLSPRRRAGSDPMISGSVLQSLPPLNGSRRTVRAAAQEPDMTQIHIDTIVQRSSMSGSTFSTPARPGRREKVYCDKWIHEGVCAFTQLGCKYLHEMPTDKTTQVSLGLNHGLPAWYRRANSIDLRPAAPAALAPTNAPRIAGPWRKLETSSSPSVPSGGRGFGSSFGPIAPPSQASSSHPSSSNPFAMFQSDAQYKEEDDDETLAWQGRGR